MVEWTNKYAELRRPPEENCPKGKERPWKPTLRRELYAYFAVVISMGITIEPAIEDYWGSLEISGTEHKLSRYISCNRFQQIDRYIRCTTPWEDDDGMPYTTFDRVDELSEYLRILCRRYYKPGCYLAVDETIERFMGRAPEIVNIPSKPTPEGFKIWVLAN